MLHGYSGISNELCPAYNRYMPAGVGGGWEEEAGMLIMMQTECRYEYGNEVRENRTRDTESKRERERMMNLHVYIQG